MKFKLRSAMVALFVALSLCAFAQAGPDDDKAKTEPSTQPALIDASDKAALDAAMDKDVEVEGTVASAAWSSSGKVLVIKFEKADESKFTAAIFEKNKEKMDKAFSGDIAKSLTGAHVRIRGKIQDFKGRPEIVISMPSQITILEAGK